MLYGDNLVPANFVLPSLVQMYMQNMILLCFTIKFILQ